MLPVLRAEQEKAVPTDGCWGQDSFTPTRADRAAMPSTLCLHPQPRYAMPLQTLAEVRPDSITLLILREMAYKRGS